MMAPLCLAQSHCPVMASTLHRADPTIANCSVLFCKFLSLYFLHSMQYIPSTYISHHTPVFSELIFLFDNHTWLNISFFLLALILSFPTPLHIFIWHSWWWWILFLGSLNIFSISCIMYAVANSLMTLLVGVEVTHPVERQTLCSAVHVFLSQLEAL